MGQSHRTNAHDTTIAMVSTATATHRQHSPATAVVRPPGAVPEAMLDAARQLLHNPPGLHASPSVVEQWHHDANQLIVVAINTMPHRGRQANHPSGAAGEPPQWGGRRTTPVGRQCRLWHTLSYPVFVPKPSTHRMHDPGSIVPHIRPKGVHR
jgi:hypothetical protein